ncbi:MAG: hypothetical protein M0R21_12495 [Lentimicrobiaceae bacterium]|jgi:hypothetical protein|nr:hypothetical protein [Lentimicrobiaceae bacterium]
MPKEKHTFSYKTTALTAAGTFIISNSLLRKTDPLLRSAITVTAGGLLGGFFPEVLMIGNGLIVGGVADFLNLTRGGAISENNYKGKLWVLLEDANTLKELKPEETIGIIKKIDGVATPFKKGYIFKVPNGCIIKILSNGDIEIKSVYNKIFNKRNAEPAGWYDIEFVKKYPKWYGLYEKSLLY